MPGSHPQPISTVVGPEARRLLAEPFPRFILPSLLNKIVLTVLLLLPALAAVHAADSAIGLADAALQEVRAESEKHCDALFRMQAGKPFVPGPIIKDWNKRGDFTRSYNLSVVLFATRALYLNEQVETADKALREMCQYHLDHPQTLLEIHSFPGMLRPLVQLSQLYGPDGSRTKGLLSAETNEVILKTMWAWVSVKSKLAEADVKESQTWTIHDSENHHANHFSSCWAVSMFLSRQPEYRERKLEDGHTTREHYEAWTNYLREYFRQRGRKGMMVEVDSPSYSAMLPSVGYWVYDLTDDPVLKRLADQFLTLWWALWAEQQIDGVCGGAKARCYPGSAMSGDDIVRRAAHFVFGFGQSEFEYAGMLPFATSSWRAPAVVMDLALDVQGRSAYEVSQRRMGLLQPEVTPRGIFHVRPEASGILRYSYCTPDFIMGSLLCEARPTGDWFTGSSQNRWHGVIFRGATNARIYPYIETDHSSYNAQWAAQHRGTFIAQKLKTSIGTQGLRVWFSKDGLAAPVPEGAWLFTEAPGAWAAVRVVSGEAEFAPEPAPTAADRKAAGVGDDGESLPGKPRGRVLKCTDDYSPVIIEVAQKANFSTLDDFRKAVLGLPLRLESNVLTYTGLSGDRFTFFTDQTQPPQVNGRPLDYSPSKVYDSPFVQSDWDSGVVTIQKGGRKLVLNFNE